LKNVVTTGNLKLNGPGNAFFPDAAEISSNKCKEMAKKKKKRQKADSTNMSVNRRHGCIFHSHLQRNI